jgi:hypothetical protein
MGRRVRGALGRLLGLHRVGGGPVSADTVTGSRQMIRPQGRPIRPRTRIDAAWYLIEEGAYPADPARFAWPEVLALTGGRPIDPRVYEPGSIL